MLEITLILKSDRRFKPLNRVGISYVNVMDNSLMLTVVIF